MSKQLRSLPNCASAWFQAAWFQVDTDKCYPYLSAQLELQAESL